MVYTGRHRKTSSIHRTKRNLAMIAAFAGIATAGSVPAANAAPMPGVGSVESVVDGLLGGSLPGSLSATVVRPTEGELTSGYGPRWGRMHNGIDIANRVGTPIHAVMSGTVIDSGPASGYGNWIRIRHDDGAVSVYGHMETLAVSVGQTVRAGDYIAAMGNRGDSTGPHLHFQIHLDGVNPDDPELWLAGHGIHY